MNAKVKPADEAGGCVCGAGPPGYVQKIVKRNCILNPVHPTYVLTRTPIEAIKWGL